MAPTALSFNAPRGPCAVCGEDGLPCARCRVHYYCGKEHQKEHWPRHRAGCGSIEVREGGLVATRDIPAETVILREIPRVTFADVNAHGALEQRLCFGCYGPLAEGRQCQRCGVPVCGEECSNDDRHAAECRVFQRAQFKVPEAYAAGSDHDFVVLVLAVRTLRTALVAQRDTRIESLPVTILDVDEDCEKRLTEVMKTSLRWFESTLSAKMGRDAIKWLRETAGVSEVSEEDLSRAALVNHFLGESVFDRNMQSCWGLFAGSAMLEPCCLPNTAQLPLDDRPNCREYVTVTSRDVAAGEHLTDMCGRWWDDSRARRTHASVKRGVACWCARCRDPTELGMYVGSPCCPSCAKNGKQAYLVPTTLDFQEWRCETCGRTMSESKVDALTRAAKKELKQCVSERHWSEFLLKYVFPRGPLHVTHTLVFQALEAFRTCVLTPDQLNTVKSQDDVTRWVETCRRLQRGLDRLLPGVSESRLVLFMSLRYLLLWRLPKPQDSMTDYFASRGMTVYRDKKAFKERFQGDLDALKQEILEATREVVRHLFTRDDAEPKFTLVHFPFAVC